MTQRTFALLDATALGAYLLTDLFPRLVPQAARARRGEGLHLERRFGVVQPDGDDALGLLLDLQAQVQTLPRQDLDAAQVDVRADRIGLAVIEGSRGRAVDGSGFGHEDAPSFW